MKDIIEIRQYAFKKMIDKTMDIKILAGQALTQTDQQRINCLDHVVAWASEILLYADRGVKE